MATSDFIGRAGRFLGRGGDLFQRTPQLLGRACGFGDAARQLVRRRADPIGRCLPLHYAAGGPAR